MNINSLLNNILPPLLRKALTRGKRRKEEIGRFRTMYRDFFGEGDLCFDIGANLGNRVRCFRSLGCRVVAVEPQKYCLKRLHKEFGADPLVSIVPKAVGASVGESALRTSKVHVLSTLSESFIRNTQQSGRFAAVDWSHSEVVDVTTLDCLIAEYGCPHFLKIDVEGYESQVLAGLTQIVPALSFEWTPEIPDNALSCLNLLSDLGDYEFNYSWGESMRLARAQWLEKGAIQRVVGDFVGENQMFGDIYARLKR